jgi:predicted DNA-binding transcriptional regulator AlpA
MKNASTPANMSPEIVQLAEALAHLVAKAQAGADTRQLAPAEQEPPPALIAPNGEELLTTRQAASMLGLSGRTLEGFRLKGGGPPYKQLGGRTVRYQANELRAWIASRSAPHTAKARDILQGR